MDFGFIRSEEELSFLLNRIKEACRDAKAGTVFEEFMIIRKQPPMPGGGPRVVFIRGVVPRGFNLYKQAMPRNSKKHAKRCNRKRDRAIGKYVNMGVTE